MDKHELTLIEPGRPASSYTDGELQQVLQSGLLRGGLVALEETLREKDRQIERLRLFNERLAQNLDAMTTLAKSRGEGIEQLEAKVEEMHTVLNAALERIYELEDAARDVLPSLESRWAGPRPIPSWHPTAALRAILEDGR